MIEFEEQIDSIFAAGDARISDILPSEWAEQKRVLTTDVSPRPGKFSYRHTPYLREVVDCLSPTDPSKIVAIEKGAQIGFSTGVIEVGIGWSIAESPCNMALFTGHADLAEEAMTTKVDNMIDNSGLRDLIQSNTKRKKNQRSGDTNTKKEFPDGSLISGFVGNHNLMRQRSLRRGFVDDVDAAPQSSKQAGNTRKLVEQRFASYESSMKLFYISTPELLETSNIHPVYLLGDQRRYHIPCQCCGEPIMLEWEIPMEDSEDNEMAGMYWETTPDGKVIKESVGYKCYKCGGVFDDSNKTEWLNQGVWIPTAEPFDEKYRSYHISALYAPVGMFGWVHYVQQYVEANPPGQEPKDDEMKTFTNTCLGMPYERIAEKPKANKLQQNTRNYQPGEIPEKLSISDGNGLLVLLTLAVDLNGKKEDARADYEIIAWSERGASYSIEHGSIGTFIPQEKEESDREKWTYESDKPRSVWPMIDKLMERSFKKDTGNEMVIGIAGIDAPGHFAKYAYHYIDNSNFPIYALKGEYTENKLATIRKDVRKFEPSSKRPKLFNLEVNLIKDDLAQMMKLNHNFNGTDPQPQDFMNYPTPDDGLYTYNGFYIQYEAEERKIEKNKDGTNKGWIWKKKPGKQNHFWDVRVYGMALKEIFIYVLGRELKKHDFTWAEYVSIITDG